MVAATISALSSDSDVGSLMVTAISSSIGISSASAMFIWAIIWLFVGYVFYMVCFGIRVVLFWGVFRILGRLGIQSSLRWAS